MRKLISAPLLAGLMFVSCPVAAYVGPGLGLGAIGVILGLLVSIVLAILALFWYPLKRLFRKRTAESETDPSPVAAGEPDGDE